MFIDKVNALKNSIAQINQEIRDTIITNESDLIVITDGVFDPDRYCKSKFKILWILKEPYDQIDDGKPWGGGWDLPENILKKSLPIDFLKIKNTFWPMIYSTYSILNNFPSWDDMPDIEDDISLIEVFKSSGYINVKKLPGHTRSNEQEIDEYYNRYQKILHKQLNIMNPDIIIGGNVLPLFFDYFKIDKQNLNKKASCGYLMKDNKIYIDAYHPAQTQVKRDIYCNDIISAIKECINLKADD